MPDTAKPDTQEQNPEALSYDRICGEGELAEDRNKLLGNSLNLPGGESRADL